MPDYWEEESERLVIELGLLGFIIIVLLRVSIFVFAVKTFKSLTDSSLKQIALIIIVLQLPSVMAFSPVTFNWLENVFYWTGVGLLVALKQVEYHEKQGTPGFDLSSG
jgi:O-antigen ligase